MGHLKTDHNGKILAQNVWTDWTGKPHFYLSLFTGDGDASVFVVLDWRAPLLDQRSISSRCEEGWNPSSACSNSLCQSTLQGKCHRSG